MSSPCIDEPMLASGFRQDETSLLSALPEECLELVFRRMAPPDVGRAACVCHAWAAIARSNSVWSNREAPAAADLVKSYTELYPGAFGCSSRDLFRFMLKGFYVSGRTAKLEIDPASGTLTYAISLGAESEAIILSAGGQQYCSEVEYAEGSPFFFMLHLTQFIPGAWGINHFWSYRTGPLTCFLPPGRYSIAWRLTRDEFWETLDVLDTSETSRHFSLMNRFWTASHHVVMIQNKLLISPKVVPEIPKWLEIVVAVLVVEPHGELSEGRQSRAELPYWMEMDMVERRDVSEAARRSSGRQLCKVELFAELSNPIGQDWAGDLYIDALVLRQIRE